MYFSYRFRVFVFCSFSFFHFHFFTFSLFHFFTFSFHLILLIYIKFLKYNYLFESIIEFIAIFIYYTYDTKRRMSSSVESNCLHL